MKSDMLPITETVLVGSLATVNDDGSPWSTPLHMAFTDEQVIWLSPADTQHSRNIERDPRVSIALWSKDELPNVKGIYVQTTAERVNGVAEVAARQRYAARLGGNIPERFADAETYVAPLGDINTTKTRGGRLYFTG